MNFNADLALRAVIYTPNQPWIDSPLPGVTRRQLERIGGEMAHRATTIVRYAAGSSFCAHQHDLGEEFLVLEGTFSDESGDFSSGMYVRNPPGSQHQPYSRNGCTILVKLRQFQTDDDQFVRIDTNRGIWQPTQQPGLEQLALFSSDREQVTLQRWAANTRIDTHSHANGEEICVLEGQLSDEQGDYPAGTWLRQPPGSSHTPVSNTGCTLYVKTGHLPLNY